MPESELDAGDVRPRCRDAITYQVLPDRGSGSSHVLVYPIPGPDGALEPGARLMNFVWYRNVASGAPFDDADDRPRRPGPARCRCRPARSDEAASCAAMRAEAGGPARRPVVAEVVTGVAEQPFVQVVFDIEVAPHGASAGSACVGDAAFALRPHAAAGTAKAAADAWALAEAAGGPPAATSAAALRRLGAPASSPLGRARPPAHPAQSATASQCRGHVGVPATRSSCSASTDRAADPAVAGGRARLW